MWPEHPTGERTIAELMSEAQSQPRVKMAIPIRVRGMSRQNKFFDETTHTTCIGPNSLFTRLQTLVELDGEIHVTNQVLNLAGNFRVVWANVQEQDGWHDVGLELTDVEGNIWGIEFAGEETGQEEEVVQAWLQCQRCHQGKLIAVPEADDEFVCDGFTILRPCEHCRASTPWGFTPAGSDGAAEGGRANRRKGRAPITMRIKVISEKHGMTIEDVCETINVSGNGAYFLSRQRYAVGELLKVIAPFEEDASGIPVTARVVRLDNTPESFSQAVAIELEREAKSGRTPQGNWPAKI